jgi:electron transport complex protein RnfB
MIPNDVYVKLARRLDAIPNGFPPTSSGVELRILARIFTRQEAGLASVLCLTPEPAAEIASRVGMDTGEAEELLRRMARKGQIRARKAEGKLVFGLIPFIVGIYENQLSLMDEELAALCEDYFQVTAGSMMGTVPSVHRVIPVERSITLDLEIFPYERAVRLIEEAKSWGVRQCICRVQRRLIGKGCDHQVENCLVFAPVEGVFDDSQDERAITKEEALRILGETEEAGLIHSTANHKGPIFYICNCCTCCCGIMRGIVEWGNPDAVAHSDFRAAVDGDVCIGCGACMERCQFGALSVPEETCLVDGVRCVGCGQCVPVCPTGALKLERRAAGQGPGIPEDEREWLARRSEKRGIDLSEIL